MRLSRSFPVWCAAALVSAVAVVGPVVATEPATTSSKNWEFRFVPYVWGAGIYGDVQIGTLPQQGVEVSFSDLLKDLNIAGMLAFEARKDRWGVLVDAMYVNVGEAVPTPDEVLYGSADVTMKIQAYTGLIDYRIYEGHDTTVDMGWGARYTRMDTDLELTSGVAAGRAKSATEDWWDWLAAVRVIGHPSKRWSLMGYADIGGGGSQLTWEGIFAAEFAFNKHVSLPFGYRYLSTDYVKNEFEFDGALQGLFLGVGFSF